MDKPDQRPDKRIVVAEINGSHGVRGLVKIRVFAQDTALLNQKDGLFTDKSGDDRLFITLKNRHKNEIWLAAIKDINNPEDAKKLNRTKLYIPESRLPEIKDHDEEGYYYTDLEGLEVRDAVTNEAIGHVKNVHNFGAGDLLNLSLKGGRDIYISFDKETVPTVNLEDGFITIIEPEMI